VADNRNSNLKTAKMNSSDLGKVNQMNLKSRKEFELFVVLYQDIIIALYPRRFPGKRRLYKVKFACFQ